MVGYRAHRKFPVLLAVPSVFTFRNSEALQQVIADS